MLVSRDKKANNIAEYVLYMWQIEDMVRAHDFDLDDIVASIIHPATDDADLRAEWKAWYAHIIKRMKVEEIERKGHMQEVNDVMVELFFLHNTLLDIHKDEKYKAIFEAALDNIKEFQRLSSHSMYNDVETCFNGMYAKLLLKLQRKEIGPATEAAMDTFRDVLAYLAKSYKTMQTGEVHPNFN